MVLLKYDGEIWEIAPGFDTDENSVSVVKAKLPKDCKAIEAGVTHIQSYYGDLNAHEVRRID